MFDLSIDERIQSSLESVFDLVEKEPFVLGNEGTLTDLSSHISLALNDSLPSSNVSTVSDVPPKYIPSPCTPQTTLQGIVESWWKCNQCNQITQELQFKESKHQEEITILSSQLKDSLHMISVLNQEKTRLCEEVEALSKDLFEEANRMVAEERRHSQEMKRVNKELLFKLEKYLK